MDPAPIIIRGFGLPSGFEWVIIGIIALLIFGPKLPSIMRSIGGSMKEFKKGMDEGPAKPVEPPPATPPAAAGGTSQPANSSPQPKA
ncbi:MAG: twin-arginine translocase TatA/TatE family subunit [Planctomycetes bacterium]|nr:twin-arginine translocase TatA/TatE family subunit [Planctomycetota bacterium]